MKTSNNNALHYSKMICAKMGDFCKPLKDYLGIGMFVHFRVHKDGKYLIVSNQVNFAESFINSIDSSLIYFREYLDIRDEYDYILYPKEPLTKCMELSFDLGFWNGITLLNKNNPDFLEFYGFLSDKENVSINNYYLKYSSALRKFVDFYKDTFYSDIFGNRADENLARLVKGMDIYIPPKITENVENNIQDFLHFINVNYLTINIQDKKFDFSNREKECIEMLSYGHSMKSISTKLSLSPRTIETYIGNIKRKTNLHSKHDLVELYNKSNWNNRL